MFNKKDALPLSLLITSSLIFIMQGIILTLAITGELNYLTDLPHVTGCVILGMIISLLWARRSLIMLKKHTGFSVNSEAFISACRARICLPERLLRDVSIPRQYATIPQQATSNDHDRAIRNKRGKNTFRIYSK